MKRFHLFKKSIPLFKNMFTRFFTVVQNFLRDHFSNDHSETARYQDMPRCNKVITPVCAGSAAGQPEVGWLTLLRELREDFGERVMHDLNLQGCIQMSRWTGDGDGVWWGKVGRGYLGEGNKMCRNKQKGDSIVGLGSHFFLSFFHFFF